MLENVAPPSTDAIAQSDRPLDRRMVAHDLWPRRNLERREGEPPRLPARVFWPETTDEVSAVVRAAKATQTPIVPFGAGSGVCNGIAPTARTWMLDVKRMGALIRVDEHASECVVEAGMIGERLERALNAHGYTLGHFPSSIYCSTVGGWVAARSAGQLSSHYGKIEDMVLGIEAVDGNGDRIVANIDDPKTGPGLLRLLIGSEGALCVFTRVRLRIHPMPTHHWLRAFQFESLDRALSTMQALMQMGECPSVIRLYDPLDTIIAGALEPTPDAPDRILAGAISQARQEYSGPVQEDDDGFVDDVVRRIEQLAIFQRPKTTRRVVGQLLSRPLIANAALDRMGSQSKLVLGFEGSGDALADRVGGIRRKVIALGGMDAGPDKGEQWLLHRHRVSYKMARTFAVGGWVDTMEVALGWEGVLPLYHGVKDALRDVTLTMCHFSHAYPDGCSLYFTFAGGGTAGSGTRSARARYDLAWERAMLTCRRHGANVSHHHGMGRSKAKAQPRTGGEAAILNALKQRLDPANILNPGVIGLGESA